MHCYHSLNLYSRLPPPALGKKFKWGFRQATSFTSTTPLLGRNAAGGRSSQQKALRRECRWGYPRFPGLFAVVLGSKKQRARLAVKANSNHCYLTTHRQHTALLSNLVPHPNQGRPWDSEGSLMGSPSNSSSSARRGKKPSSRAEGCWAEQRASLLTPTSTHCS